MESPQVNIEQLCYETCKGRSSADIFTPTDSQFSLVLPITVNQDNETQEVRDLATLFSTSSGDNSSSTLGKKNASSDILATIRSFTITIKKSVGVNISEKKLSKRAVHNKVLVIIPDL